MRTKFILLLTVPILIISCSRAPKPVISEEKRPLPSTGNFGMAITPDGAIPSAQLLAMLKDKDSVDAKVEGKIVASCKGSGCWMNIDLGNDKVLEVTFRNDGFTIPTDAQGKTAIVQGKAFKDYLTENEEQTEKKEGGQMQSEDSESGEDIIYSFIADGVIIK